MSEIATGIEGILFREMKLWSDSRGWLGEFYRRDEIDHAPAMAYMSQTEPGAARGPHEHLYQTDLFVFAGPGRFAVYLYDNRPESPTHRASFIAEVGEGRPASLLVPPRVIHAYRCVSECAGLIVNMPDKLYKGPGRKLEIDEIRHEDRAESPFYTAFERELFGNDLTLRRKSANAGQAAVKAFFQDLYQAAGGPLIVRPEHTEMNVVKDGGKRETLHRAHEYYQHPGSAQLAEFLKRHPEWQARAREIGLMD